MPKWSARCCEGGSTSCSSPTTLRTVGWKSGCCRSLVNGNLLSSSIARSTAAIFSLWCAADHCQHTQGSSTARTGRSSSSSSSYPIRSLHAQFQRHRRRPTSSRTWALCTVGFLTPICEREWQRICSRFKPERTRPISGVCVEKERSRSGDEITSQSSSMTLSRSHSNDGLPRASLGRIERGDGIVEGRSGADVRPQSSVPQPLDDLAQLGTIGLDNEVDRQTGGGPCLARSDDGHQ